MLIIYSLFLVLFLFLSAFFSGSETAFFSLNSLEREKMKPVQGKCKGKIVRLFFTSPDTLLVTILTGNMIVNIFATDFFASTVTGYVVSQLPFIDPEVFSILVMIPLILLFGEMTPKNIAVRHPLAFARLSILPLYFFHLLFLPITGLLNIIRFKILKRIPVKKKQDDHPRDSLISFAMKVGHERGFISKYELDVLESYLEFRNKSACDVMIPRTEISGIEASTPLNVLFDIIAQENSKILSGSFIYVYKQDYDHLTGYIDIRDLLPIKYGIQKSVHVRKLIKPFYKIPDSKNLSDLTRELREKNHEVALVIDEYGGTAGIVTFQNIITDLLDYFYTSAKDMIEEISHGVYSLPGTVETGILEDLFHVHLPTEKRTVSGMIMEHLGEVPARGTQVTIEGILFTVCKPGKTKIIQLHATKVSTG
jgi:putative hemolysin